MDLDVLLQATRKELPTSRWEHTLRVKETAEKLAEREGVDLDKTRVAAILHDYCKFWPDDRLVNWIQTHHLPQDLLAYNKELWHAFVGAEAALRLFQIEDEEILNAIRYHTTGRPNMSKLEKIIWLADYIEPGRRFPGVDEVRACAEKDLDQALLKAINQTIVFLIERGQKVYPLTLSARNDVLEQVQKQSREESF